MSHLNYKNQLQEFCQKYNLELPKYQIEELHRPDTQNWFTATVDVNLHFYRGPVRNSKREAELAVAEIAYLDIQDKITHRKIVYKGPVTSILIDVENKPKIIEELYEWVEINKSPHLIVIGVISANHPLVLSGSLFRSTSGYWQPNEKTSIIKVNSTRADASDTWLSFLAGKLLGQGMLGSRCLIISHDHFAHSLAECLQEHGVKCQVVVTVQQILSFLQKT